MDFEIRQDRAVAQGRKRLIREREQYFRFVHQGYSNKEASRLVGVNERTGREWRNGRDAPGRFRPPARSSTRTPVPAASGRYLSQGERLYIADRLRNKASLRMIAEELGRSPSTINREIQRNRTLVPRQPVPLWALRCPEPHRRPPASAQAREDESQPAPAGLRPGRPGQAVEPGTDSSPAPPGLPR